MVNTDLENTNCGKTSLLYGKNGVLFLIISILEKTEKQAVPLFIKKS